MSKDFISFILITGTVFLLYSVSIFAVLMD